MKKESVLIGMVIWILMAAVCWAKPASKEADFTELSIEDLMTLEVTTVAKKGSSVFCVPKLCNITVTG